MMEAARLGMERMLVSGHGSHPKAPKGLTVVPVKRVSEVHRVIFNRPRPGPPRTRPEEGGFPGGGKLVDRAPKRLLVQFGDFRDRATGRPPAPRS